MGTAPEWRMNVASRVLAAGGAACSDVELLGIVLDGGRGSVAAVDVARDVLDEAARLADLDRLEPGGLATRLGRGGRRRVVVLRAALELGRRAATRRPVQAAPVRSGRDVYAHYRGRLPQLTRETFWVLLLDGRNRLRDELCVSVGTLTAALVHPREVFGPALRAGAASVILVHNHPSGDPAPSVEDVDLTRRLVQAGDLVGVAVLDHVVVAQAGWASVMDRL
jgi:DNA repair protein RadC